MEALLKQLASHGLTSHSSDLLKELKSKQRPLSLGQIMTLLQTEVKTYFHVFTVIDALDEYSDVVRKDFMAKIQSLSSVKLLVTSWPIDSIGHDTCAYYRLDITAKDSDIKSYLKGQLSSSHASTLKRLISKPSSSIREEDIIARVTMKAQGM
jgi:hypothetical protein